MHGMQYEFTLPADYDMGIIRERVAAKGHLLDDFPGLAFKAYLVRERGVAGSPVNQYAPFYLWRTGAGMTEFLRGPGFRTLSADFGRPPVRHWLAAGLHLGPAADREPATAVREQRLVPETEDAGQALDAALAGLGDRPGLCAAAVALDPERWELTRFSLWHHDAPDHGTRYRVLHLSRPEIRDL
ncbi:DUF4865 family protein [Kitasatospora cinereorecta]|uniref:DUF4865 family protein n=1 Tax=Kitasatospora cinereorecta TaxID=285560 RepID=A0ABW0VC11_9ACTN